MSWGNQRDAARRGTLHAFKQSPATHRHMETDRLTRQGSNKAQPVSPGRMPSLIVSPYCAETFAGSSAEPPQTRLFRQSRTKEGLHVHPPREVDRRWDSSKAAVISSFFLRRPAAKTVRSNASDNRGLVEVPTTRCDSSMASAIVSF